MLRLTYLPFIYLFNLVHALIVWGCAGMMTGIRFALVVMPTTDWRLLPTALKASAFRMLRPLKPVYRESYLTHGLSLTAGHPA